MARSPILRDHAAGLPLVRPVAVPIDREAMRSEHERSVEQGRSVGYADGLAKARDQARVDAEGARSRLESALGALAAAVDATTSALALERGRLDGDAVDLAFAIAEAVIGRELAVSRSPGSDAVRRALGESVVEDGVILRMNPADAAEVTGSPLLVGVTTVVPDPTIGPGGCVAELGPVLVDARIETALSRAAGARRSDRSAMTDLVESVRARSLAAARPHRYGRVVRMVGMSIEAAGITAAIGDSCRIIRSGAEPVLAEVVALNGDRVSCLPFGDTTGLGVGALVEESRRPLTVGVGEGLLGRILNGLGQPIDDGPPLVGLEEVGIDGTPPHPLRRGLVAEQLGLGVRVLDGLVPCGKGQRLGIFAGSGVGKSSLMSMITRGTSAEVSVIALVGERGREVAEFVERDLGRAGLGRSVVIVATSDEPALVRIRAAFLATRIAEWFRDRGQHVLLLMDSLTRFAMAQREIGLAAGEPPATRGYPPSVFGLLPRLLERAGMAERGSITGLYTVLVEGDDMNEPIADTARSILDGHIVLSRQLAEGNHYPAVDVLASISRVAPAISRPEQLAAAGEVRRLLGAWRDAKDLIEIDAYVPGTNRLVDRAIALKPRIDAFTAQPKSEQSALDETIAAITSLAPPDDAMDAA